MIDFSPGPAPESACVTLPTPYPTAAQRFAHVDTWVFDLDNTLYPFGCDLWPQIDARITAFLCDLFGIDGLSAKALQKHYYERYGTSLRGLMLEDGLNPQDFLDFVHDIDRSGMMPDEALATAIAALPGRKLILTNGSHEHALRTCERLGIAHLFEGIFDIVAADLVPKPEAATYKRFFYAHAVDPARAAMFEDLDKNLVAPHASGMLTVLVREVDAAPLLLPHVDFYTTDLTLFLSRLMHRADR